MPVSKWLSTAQQWKKLLRLVGDELYGIVIYFALFFLQTSMSVPPTMEDVSISVLTLMGLVSVDAEVATNFQVMECHV